MITGNALARPSCLGVEAAPVPFDREQTWC